jgi:AcrR family transcriptional regulator
MTDEKTVTRRERRIAARKAQILEAAADIFRIKGYSRATTKEIADAADVSEGTLYNYFNSKRDLLIGLTQDFATETVEAIADIQAENVEDIIIQVLTGRFEHIRKKRMLTLFLHEARMDAEIHRHYVKEALSPFIREAEERIQVLIDAGIMRPVHPGLAARTFVAAMTGFAIMFEVGDDAVIEEMSSEDLAATVADIFLNGLYPCPADEEGNAS